MPYFQRGKRFSSSRRGAVAVFACHGAWINICINKVKYEIFWIFLKRDFYGLIAEPRSERPLTGSGVFTSSSRHNTQREFRETPADNFIWHFCHLPFGAMHTSSHFSHTDGRTNVFHKIHWLRTDGHLNARWLAEKHTTRCF